MLRARDELAETDVARGATAEVVALLRGTLEGAAAAVVVLPATRLGERTRLRERAWLGPRAAVGRVAA